MLRQKLIALSLLLVAVVGILFTQVLSAKASLPEKNRESDLILFNRSVTLSTSEIYGSILVFDTVTGEEAPVMPDNDVFAFSWSHDGRRILGGQINGEFPASLIVVDSDGQNRKQLVSFNQIVTSNPIWPLDDERIIFWGSPLKEKYWAIFEVPADGGEPHRLSQPFFGLDLQGLTISPDGSQILFTGGGNLFTMPAKGGEATRVSLPFQIGSNLEWSPDGTQIAVSAYITDPSNNSRFEGIYLITPDGRETHLLIARAENMTRPSSLQWSPDGSHMFFFTMGTHGYTSLGLITLETGDIRTYHVGQGVLVALTRLNQAIWSPDGKQIVLSAGTDRPYTRNLYLVDRDLTQIQRLTEGREHDQPVQWRSQR